jgi:hypothetical protein
MPLWGDLSKALTDELKDYSPSSVLDGISAYEHEFDRARLVERLSELLLNYNSSDRWQLRAAIMKALHDFPEARDSVARALRDLHALQEPDAPTP